MTERRWKVVVIGAGGAQAQAMLAGAARGTDVSGWLAVDLRWRPEALAATQALGISTIEEDPLADPGKLRELTASAEIVANFAGPYYRTGTLVLDAAIDTRTHYLDICDDADATLPMLDPVRTAAAEEAGVTALVGMGSSPGTTNILIRAAVDHLGPVENVDISWTVDVDDVANAALRHFWHCFNLVDPDGTTHPVSTWEDLEQRTVDFPGTVGRQVVVRLAHPEPLTIPRFLPVKSCGNFGAVTPYESMVTAWGLAHAVDPQRTEVSEATLDAAVAVFSHYRDTRPATARLGSGLQIDVHTGGNGLRFASGAPTPMEDATGIPAAAGLLMLQEGKVRDVGVIAPEVLSPADFFTTLRRVSTGGGGLGLYRLENGKTGERLRIRDLIRLDTATES
ncbi:saccharopine dehydrogenase family protein [Streptomyces afghaniensis]|uniref:saccharopine dehydrogenase family protein n=1 Tax=Streptomyces afghaniensis TaxID=66865 RepID=UPI003794225E